MLLHEKLYQLYLEELWALEAFRKEHRVFQAYEELAEDPDTKRITEALAFFIARNRLQGQQQIVRLYQKLFQQYFSFLAHPLPAMGLLQVTPALDMPEKVDLATGSEVLVHLNDGRQAYFQTLAPLSLLPIHLVACEFAPLAPSGWQLQLRYRAASVRTEPLGTLSLCVNHLQHFSSALSVICALKNFLQKATICYGATSQEAEKHIDCSFSFGAWSTGSLFTHPVEKVRSHLHFPEQELFLHIQVPKTAIKWQTFSICLQLASGWPKAMQLTKDSLIPFVVPIANLKKEFSTPIHCDGKKDHYPVLYPTADEGFSLHSLSGVYEVRQHKMYPLKPGIIAPGHGSYEAMRLDASSPMALQLDFHDAIHNPKLIAVEALWSQPWLSQRLEQETKPKILHPFLVNAEMRLLGKSCPQEDAAITYDVNALMQVLALKNRNISDLEEILFLVKILKNTQMSHFKGIPSSIENLEIKKQYNHTAGQPLTSYHFILSNQEASRLEVTLLFFTYLQAFLNTWSSHTDSQIYLSYSHVHRHPLPRNLL